MTKVTFSFLLMALCKLTFACPRKARREFLGTAIVDEGDVSKEMFR